MPVVGFVGMTHLGLNSAVAGAARGFEMLGFDPDAALIGRLREGRMPVSEPKLAELAAEHAARLTYSADPAALARCGLIYIAADVPTDGSGSSDPSVIESLLDIVYRHAAPDAVIVILSQVSPGFSRAHLRPGCVLFYQVEVLIFGQAIERALNPERYIVGALAPEAELPDAYRRYLAGHGNPPVLKMAYESAELAKISINCCLVASVSVANMLAELCEAIGADWSEIAPALKLDRRIGPHSYLTPGLGISGGNLERDLGTVMRLSQAHGTDSGVVRAWVDNSGYRKDWPFRTLAQRLPALGTDPVIAVLGATYKENTDSVKNSPAEKLIRQLAGHRVKIFDPQIAPPATWHPALEIQGSMEDAVAGADVLLLMTAWPIFRTLAPRDIAQAMRGRTVIDPFALLDRKAAREAGLDHVVLGAAPPP